MAEPDTVRRFDVLIVGGGLVGLTLAGLLQDSNLRIGIIEKQKPQPVGAEVDIRVSAINRASIKLFQTMGVWDEMHGRACAFREMHVWDSTGAGNIHFDSAKAGLDCLGYIIENTVLQQALLAGIRNQATVEWLCPASLTAIELSDEGHRIRLENGEILSCRLLVGADGASSRVREAAAIELRRASYGQQGIVCTVATEKSHDETAWQCFLPTGPLAFLPLFDGRSSIVWSMDESRVAEVLALEEAAFCRQLELAFEYQLGAVTAVGPRAAFPLAHGHVDHYVEQGLALIGDAAHTIHPLAGQGANLGFMDAASLAEVIKQALAANRQWYALHTLRKYERARKGENRLMETAMTAFKLLFGNDDPMLVEIRNTGLGLVDQLPVIKQQFMRHAMGA